MSRPSANTIQSKQNQILNPNDNQPNLTIGRLTNRAGGDLMVSGTDLQFYNEFLSNDVAEVPPELANSYKSYRKKKNAEIAEKERLNVVARRNQPVTPTVSTSEPAFPDRQQRYQNRVSQLEAPRLPIGPNAFQPSPRSYERKRKIYIDSADRNKTLYPDASDFVISWGRTFQNVKSMRLVSLEFPNVVQAIGPRNNVLQWINLEDNDLEIPFPTYRVALRPGSYDLEALAEEMTAALKTVRRRGGAENAPNHVFIVETNIETDYVSFASLIAQPADRQPITTVAGSSKITFTQENHGYRSGERVHILGVQNYVGGIPASDINGAYIITRVDDNTFSFEVQAFALATGKGGGSLISTGRESPFQFQFGTCANPLADLIGFPVENSSQTLTSMDGLYMVEDPLTTVVLEVTGVIPGTPFTQIVSPEHGLNAGDRIFLYNVFVTPSFYENDRHKGIFEVFAVASPDVFLIKYASERVSDVSNAFVGTQVIQMYFPNHGFNRIVNIEQQGVNNVLITTLYDHGFTALSTVRIAESNSEPSIDGHYVVTPVDSDSFTISGADPMSPLVVDSPGYKGILAADYDFRLQNVKPFGGFTSMDLNNTTLTVRDVIDQDTFTFNCSYGFSRVWERGGGTAIRINSKLHGWSGSHSNFLNGVLFRPVKLDGDNYAFMCIPGLNSDSIATSGKVRDIFSKLFITLNPGLVIFDAFDSSPLDFFTPVPKLDELRFTIRSPNDTVITFNGLDYSFGLELIELVQADAASNQSSQRLAPPAVA